MEPQTRTSDHRLSVAVTTRECREEYHKTPRLKFPERTSDPPLQPKVLKDASGPTTGKDVKVKSTAPPKKKKSKTKDGRVSITIRKGGVKRHYTYYGSQPLSFGEDVGQNRKVFELLAAYVLLCVKSLQEQPKEPLDATVPDLCVLTREVRARAGKFSFQQIALPYGIQFHKKPMVSETNFYAMRQLGYGETGTSCFACTSSASPCVIKFFRNSDDSFTSAQNEAEKWQDTYGHLKIGFVKAYNAPRAILVMPFLKVPCNFQERKKFVEGERDSLLYQALLQVSSRKYIHGEVFWHHIGLLDPWIEDPPVVNEFWTSRVMNIFRKPQGRNSADTASVEPPAKPIAVFCDLAHATRCDDDAARTVWVEKSFQAMKECIGSEPNRTEPSACN